MGRVKKRAFINKGAPFLQNEKFLKGSQSLLAMCSTYAQRLGVPVETVSWEAHLWTCPVSPNLLSG